MSDDQDRLERDISTGAKAAQELQILDRAFEDVKAALGAAWAGTQARDRDARELLWQATTLLTRVEEALHRYVVKGKFAEGELMKLITEQETDV